MKEEANKKTSIVWSHFNEDSKKISCQPCKAEFKPSKTTSQLLRHLKLQHSSIFKNNSTQSNLCSKNLKFQPLSSHKIKQLDLAIARLVAYDLRPFLLVEGRGFKQFIHLLEPRYQIPSRKRISSELIPDLYQFQKKILEDQLMSSHWIDQQFSLLNKVLQTKEVTESHTGEHMSELVNEILAEFKIAEQKLIFKSVSTDKGSNNVKCFNSYKKDWKHYICFAHTIHNNILQIYKIEPYNSIISKVRNISKIFRNSSKFSTLLIAKQKDLQIPVRRLKVDVKTRWNSTFAMLQRFIENEKAILLILIEQRKQFNNYLLENEEWTLVNDLISELRPYEQLINYISSD
ncbi:hypothetical protein ABPG72_002906 [Tetrahymena utriculariae]